jgi:hypothetical protein
MNLKQLYLLMNTVCQQGYFVILGYLFCSLRKLILWAFNWNDSNSIPLAWTWTQIYMHSHFQNKTSVLITVFSSITNKMQRYTIYLFIYFCEMLYMFQAVPPPIIRSSKLYTASGTSSNLYCYLPWQWQVAVQVWRSTRCRIYSCELLMMGGGTAWNM